ncbi:MAG: penicillin-binding protein 1C [Treponema sp.]|nr:penicillin-binding protein 1C [Treponema sp.]
MKKNILSIALTMLSIVVFSFLILRFSPYPALSDFRSHDVSTRIYDAHGELIQIVALENGVRREFVPLEKIPPFVQQIFLQAEDRRFYQHHGIDFGAIIRASFQNASEGRTVSGASTITMQLARIIRPNLNRTLPVKIREAFDAFRLEMRLSKREILELYLNNVPFGFNAEGIASAARTFFGSSAQELSQEQAFCLAVIPRRPALYNPLTNPSACAKAATELYAACQQDAPKKDLALNEISDEQFLSAANSAKSFSYPFEMPHFVRWLSLQKDLGIGRKADVYTTADLDLQHLAENQLARAVERYAANRLTNGAILVCDSQSGAIRAWVGSADFFDDAHNGQLDGVLAKRQPGSSMKPFLYALSLERGYTPSSVLPDIPLEFGFDRLYVPQNFNNRFNGPVRLRVALASSLNIPAVYLLNEIGMEQYLKKLNDLHFDSLKDADPGLGLALGNAEVSVFELTQAFSVFPRDGIFVPLQGTEYLDKKNATPSADDAQGAQKTRVYDENTARLICDILSDSDARALGFGFSQTFRTPFAAMFKTGTANQYQNITALAATPHYTVGVWMGNFSGETVVGKTGSSIPAKIARDLLVSLQGRSGKNFSKPAQFKKERLCALSGMHASSRCPDTVTEYVAAGTPRTECTWHTPNGTAYPAEYASWFRIKNRSGKVNDLGTPLRIISPRNGSLFYYDDSISESQQKLVVEATGGAEETARFFADGKLLTETKRPFVAHVPITRGAHTVTVRCGEEQSKIDFVVK